MNHIKNTAGEVGSVAAAATVVACVAGTVAVLAGLVIMTAPIWGIILLIARMI